MATGELACTYASLILHDDGIDITAEKIATLVKTANLNIESYWPGLFAKLCQNISIDDLVMNAGSGGSYAAAPMAVSSSFPVDGGATQVAPAAEQKKKEEVKEESEDDMVFGLFD